MLEIRHPLPSSSADANASDGRVWLAALLLLVLATALVAFVTTHSSRLLHAPPDLIEASDDCGSSCDVDGSSALTQPVVFRLEAGASMPMEQADIEAREALLLQQDGRYAEAEALLNSALQRRREAYGDTSPEVAGTLARLGLLLEQGERYVEADAASRQALELWLALPGPEATVTRLLQLQLARIRCLRNHGTGSSHCLLNV